MTNQPPPHVTLTHADAEQLPIVQHMFVAYFYDMSQYDDNLIINDFGLPTWAPSGLPGPRTPAECVQQNWWIRDRCEHYVIRANGQPAGFTIICRDRGHLAPEIDNELLDFYVVPKYRRLGLGRQAARLALDLHGGTWQIFQLERNLPARTFWQSVITEYTGGQFENLDGGTQQRFRV